MRVNEYKKRNNLYGFTIVELLIVVVVMGILAGIVTIGYNAVTDRAVRNSMESDLQKTASAVKVDRASGGLFPVNAAAVDGGKGLKPSGDNQLNYVVMGNNFCVSVSHPRATEPLRYRSADGKIETGKCEITVATLSGSGTAGFADGPGATAQFNAPYGLAVDAAGTIYVADSGNHRIRKITPGGVVSTLAGSGTAGFADGPGATARFNAPKGIAVGVDGTVYVGDSANHRIRTISPSGVVSTLAGTGVANFTDGPGATARFYYPYGVAVNAKGTVYVADSNNVRIRAISPSGVVSTLAGSGTTGSADGTGAAAQFFYPVAITIDAAGTLYVADHANNRIRAISPSGVVSTLAGSGTRGAADGSAATAQFYYPYDVTVDTTGTVYAADTYNNRIRAITSTGVVSTLAGTGAATFADGPGATAKFNAPYGVAVDAAGAVYVGDFSNNRIRKISL